MFDVLLQVVHTERAAWKRLMGAQFDFQFRSAGENPTPGLPNVSDSCIPGTARMNAHDALILGPDGHHFPEVSTLQCLVESLLCLQGSVVLSGSHPSIPSLRT